MAASFTFLEQPSGCMWAQHFNRRSQDGWNAALAIREQNHENLKYKNDKKQGLHARCR
jgi:hypothetical protein